MRGFFRRVRFRFRRRAREAAAARRFGTRLHGTIPRATATATREKSRIRINHVWTTWNFQDNLQANVAVEMRSDPGHRSPTVHENGYIVKCQNIVLGNLYIHLTRSGGKRDPMLARGCGFGATAAQQRWFEPMRMGETKSNRPSEGVVES